MKTHAAPAMRAPSAMRSPVHGVPAPENAAPQGAFDGMPGVGEIGGGHDIAGIPIQRTHKKKKKSTGGSGKKARHEHGEHVQAVQGRQKNFYAKIREAAKKKGKGGKKGG